MLAAIESRLEELFETIESLPPEKVETAEKVCLLILYTYLAQLVSRCIQWTTLANYSFESKINVSACSHYYVAAFFSEKVTRIINL